MIIQFVVWASRYHILIDVTVIGRILRGLSVARRCDEHPKWWNGIVGVTYDVVVVCDSGVIVICDEV